MTRPEFVPLEVKSVLNRVTGMPFRWSINPYRGCSHGCVFCVSGETPILMADGTMRALESVRVGDAIYGTVRSGSYRRYAHTDVLAHWSSEKPAFRITLQDGTKLIASGDHRFLTDRGWKFVTRGGSRGVARPYLTRGNTMMGPGRFTPTPPQSPDYKRGYLCGLIRGDGLLRWYHDEREGHAQGGQHQFRLALTDREALSRARTLLLELNVPTRSFVMQPARGPCRQIDGIGTNASDRFETIERIVRWPTQPSPEWRRGFLAGIFDAAASYSGGVLRISHTDPVITATISRCLAAWGFSFVTEARSGAATPVRNLRVVGGLSEQLRFFHTVDPAIARQRNIAGRVVEHRSRLRVAAIEPLGLRRLFDITTGTGDFIANGVISHNCYARRTHWFMDEDGVNEWASRIFVKVNAPEVLRRELSRRTWKREEVALGTATDPYQAVEGRYRITRRILEALRDFRTPVSIVTRCPLIVRDADLLGEIAERAGASVCLSIATMDSAAAREIEPTVAPPAQRLRALRVLRARGIRAGVLLAPVLPGLTDSGESLAAVVRAAADAGACFVWHRVLYLGEVTRDAFRQFLARRHPELVPLYRTLYRGQYAPSGYRRGIDEIVTGERARAGGFGARYVSPPRPAEQLTLISGL